MQRLPKVAGKHAHDLFVAGVTFTRWNNNKALTVYRR
jgi:hypothetical protein